MLPGSNVSAPYKKFGAWDAGPPWLANTAYQAARDGEVFGFGGTAKPTITGKTDSATPPTTTRILDYSYNDGGNVGTSMKVRKNDYWKLEVTAGSLTIFFIPDEP